jgi:hypothetical protein
MACSKLCGNSSNAALCKGQKHMLAHNRPIIPLQICLRMCHECQSDTPTSVWPSDIVTLTNAAGSVVSIVLGLIEGCSTLNVDVACTRATIGVVAATNSSRNVFALSKSGSVGAKVVRTGINICTSATTTAPDCLQKHSQVQQQCPTGCSLAGATNGTAQPMPQLH